MIFFNPTVDWLLNFIPRSIIVTFWWKCNPKYSFDTFYNESISATKSCNEPQCIRWAAEKFRQSELTHGSIKSSDPSCLQDGCSSGRGFSIHHVYRQQNSISNIPTPEAPISVFTFPYHFCPQGIWITNEIFSPVVWVIPRIMWKYQRVRLKDSPPHWAASRRGIQQPINFPSHKQVRRIWAPQYVLL